MNLPLSWADQGRALGATLDACHAVVIVGVDSTETAEVALGVARAQSSRRRVVVGDLFGEAPPLTALVHDDDAHGITDSFSLGVSLNRIAYPVPEDGELFILPSGISPIEYEELFGNPRWKRLMTGFREVGALLILVAPVTAERLRDLVDASDGLVIVGNKVPSEIPVAQSLAWLKPMRASTPVREAPAAREEPPARPSTLIRAPRMSMAGDAPLAAVRIPRPRSVRTRRNVMIAGIAAGVLLTLSLSLAGLWLAGRPLSTVGRLIGLPGGKSPLELEAERTAERVRMKLRADSARRDSIARANAAVAVPDSANAPLVVLNPRDSAGAAAWAVRLEATNTKAGALLSLRGRFLNAAAATYAVDAQGRYFLVAGAQPTRASAEALLVQLRTQKVLAPDAGSVASLPFAFLVQADVPVADVPSRLRRLAGQGDPIYALRQSDLIANIYFGAYESPQQAALATAAVRGAGLTPTLVYRMGRVF
ncbi:MAG: hypothetical protein V4550_05455 [Gemmatimonadota bacterium]